MDACQQEMTFDCMPNVVEELESVENPSVSDEISRCRKLYEDRQVLKRKKAIEIKPLYHEHMTKKDLVAKYPVYKFFCTQPKPLKKYGNCQHIGQIILDRDILTKDEHISFLAQPKRNLGRFPKPQRCMYQKRFLPNCTTRIESLSHPKPLRVQQNWQEYSHLLSVRQAANLRKNLQRPPIEYTSIENALTYIHEERRLRSEMKNEAVKRCNQIKRKLMKMEKQYITKIIFALYEVMKEFLITDQFVMDTGELSSLCKVIECKIVQFYGLDNASTSHVHHLIKTVAQNLAIWIEKFTSNCGFKNQRTQKEARRLGGTCKEMEEQEFLLPVEDFIPYNSPSLSERQEGNFEGEEYERFEDYEDEN